MGILPAMGKIHTIFNPMSGKEAEIILILGPYPDAYFQQPAQKPFWATFPGHIPYLWKPQCGAYRQQAVRIRQEPPNSISRRRLKQVGRCRGKLRGSGGHGGEGGGSTGRGRIRRTGLTSDWLGWFWRKSQLGSPVRSCPTFQQLWSQGSGALD